MTLTESCQALLEIMWNEFPASDTEVTHSHLSDEICQSISRSINSDTKTYRYVLPTQILAKLANWQLDCRCVQSKRGGQGAFDARTVAHGVIVPFDRSNNNVLGGSSEPYVSKPLRCDAVTLEHLKDKRDKPGWEDLCTVLTFVETAQDEQVTRDVMRQVLMEIRKRLEVVAISYPTPHRISQQATCRIVNSFLVRRSGGVRFESIVAACFHSLQSELGIFSKVTRSHTNSADSQSGSLADVECYGKNGEKQLVVEAKDRTVTLRHVQDKLPALRENEVSEALFITTVGVESEDSEQLQKLIEREFASGQNLYIADFSAFLATIFILIGEPGRRQFCKHVGAELDQHASLSDRQSWATLLAGV